MIFQEGGRWRSELTALEKQMDVDDIVGKLTPEEYAALEHMLGDFELQGTSAVADECADLEWEEVPLPIEEWLDSYHHVGDTGSTIFPVLKKDLIELFSGGYHEVILCLHPGTRIPLLDGSTPTIKELSDRWEEDQEPFWVYSYVNGEIGPAKAVHPRKTGIDDYYRVTLDDGSTFTGNSRHQMLRRDGEKVMIKDMVPGDSLMPFNVKISSREQGNSLNGYEQTQLLSGKWEYTHRISAKQESLRESTKHSVVHHADFDKLNNDPTNLKWMTWPDHTRLHADLAYRERRTDITLDAIKQSGATSLQEAAEILNCSWSRIRRVLRNHETSQVEFFGNRKGRRRGKADLTLEAIYQAVDSGITSCAAVSRHLGRDRTTLHRFLSDLGLSWEDVSPNSHRPLGITLQQIEEAIESGSVTLSACAARLDCSVGTIQNTLRKHNKNWKDLKKVAIGAGNHFVISVEKIGNGPVYCMTVPEAGNFAIATDAKGGANPGRRSGVISSNTGSIGWG